VRPTLEEVRALLAPFPGDGDDASLRRFGEAVGRRPDLRRPDHVAAARVWLNAWGCRLAYPASGADDVLALSLGAWWDRWRRRLPPPARQLVDLADRDLDVVAAAYGELAASPAAPRRSLGPTAASKLLYALRPAAVTPWDRDIAARPGVAGDFRAHLADVVAWAQALQQEADGLGVVDVAGHVGRPRATLARALDEALWAATR
jgi:hypothetical protein